MKTKHKSKAMLFIKHTANDPQSKISNKVLQILIAQGDEKLQEVKAEILKFFVEIKGIGNIY